MLYGGFDFHTRAAAPTSELLAKAWGPFMREAIDAFGPGRAMMESNFPVDNQTASFPVIWNALKRITADYSASERALIFHGTAQRAYRLSSDDGHPKTMKLYWSSRSPFARKVMIAAHELGIADRIATRARRRHPADPSRR